MSSPSPKTVAIALVGVIAALAIAGLPFYVFPKVDEPGATDVIYVIGPATPSRIDLAEGMLDAGLSDTLMLSVPDPAEFSLCDSGREFTVFCDRPQPFTTQGEARYLAAMAAEHGWTSATVITMTPHITRTRLLMERCFAGTLRLLPDPAPIPPDKWVYQYLYQTGAFVKVALTPGC